MPQAIDNFKQFFYSGTGVLIVYGLLILAIILSLIAQVKVKSTYSKYAKINNTMGLTGGEAARRILDANGLTDVDITPIAGTLTDHYDPRTNTISLSQDIFYGQSIAAVGIAAHEVGHAIQHARNYVPVKIRSAMVPAVNVSSNLSWILIMIGLLINSMAETNAGYGLAVFGVILFSLATLFHIVTLPVELNASNRAKAQVAELFAPSSDERKGIRKVLTAAAMTYVAALLASIANLLRVMQIVGRSRRS